MSEDYSIGDRVTITDYPEPEYNGKHGTVEAFDYPHTLIRVDGENYTQRFYPNEFGALKDNSDIEEVGQTYLDLLNAAIKDGSAKDEIWTLGFIHAFINDVEEALA